MPSYPNTGSTLSRDDGRNKTSTSSSTNIIIKVNGSAIGAVQSLNIDEDRQITFFDEVGTDGHIDSMPTRSTNITGTCERIRFDRMRIAHAFSRGFVHASSQIYPFDINIYDTQNGDEDSDEVIITVFKNVWIKKISYGHKANDWVISDSMSWECEHVYSMTGGGLSVVEGGDERGDVIPEELTFADGTVVSVEGEADRSLGGRRGSFDISKILQIAGSDETNDQ